MLLKKESNNFLENLEDVRPGDGRTDLCNLFFFYFAFNYNASIEILKLWIAWCDFLSDLKHVY